MRTPALYSPLLQYMHTHSPVLLHRDLKPQLEYLRDARGGRASPKYSSVSGDSKPTRQDGSVPRNDNLHAPLLQYMHTHDPVVLHRDLKPQLEYLRDGRGGRATKC